MNAENIPDPLGVRAGVPSVTGQESGIAGFVAACLGRRASGSAGPR
jgi:hypothetical protein